MRKYKRIFHFIPSELFGRKFLFHPEFRLDKPGTETFFIGTSGYTYDQRSFGKIFYQYVKAIKILAKGMGGENRQAIAYCHTTKFSLPAILLCRIFGVGHVIYFNHGVPFIGHNGFLRVILLTLERVNVLLSHQFVTVSSSMVHCLKPSASQHPFNYATKPGSSSGLQVNEFIDNNSIKKRLILNNSDGVIYLYAGRPEFRKGIYILLEAWERHYEKFPDDELWLCGFDASNLVESVRKKITGIIFYGYVQDMKNIFDKVDVVISPSFHEGFGYSLLEGAARGCCIISSDIPGPDVMFTRWMKRFLFPVRSVDGLLGVMEKLSRSRKFLNYGKLLSFRSALRFKMNFVVFPKIDSL